MANRVEFRGYYVRRDERHLQFGSVFNGVHVELLEVDMTHEPNGLMLSPRFLNEVDAEDARQELWRQILREIGFEQDPKAPWPLKNHRVPKFINTREDILEYLRLLARGLLSAEHIGRLTQLQLHDALVEMDLL